MACPAASRLSAWRPAPVRTDRRDAEGIAQLLRTGWFQPVHCRPVASRETRALPGSRNALAEGLTRPGLPVRGILRDFGLKPGRVSKGDFEERVREPASGSAMLPDAVEPILRLRAQMRDELAVMTKRIKSLAVSDATCRQLMTMPGTGPVTATAFVAAVDDPARFRRARDIGARAGLTPKRNRSGETDVSGGISKTGDIALRKALFQAATAMPTGTGRMNWLQSRALRVAGSAPRPRRPGAWPWFRSGCGWTGRSSASPASRRCRLTRHERGCNGSAVRDEEGRSGHCLLRGIPSTDVPLPGRGLR